MSIVEFVSYDGDYPNLCSGELVLRIDGIAVEFPRYCMSSGGSAGIDDDLMEDHYTDLSCGHHVRGAAREFDFCPECGARVIGGQPR